MILILSKNTTDPLFSFQAQHITDHVITKPPFVCILMSIHPRELKISQLKRKKIGLEFDYATT